MDDLEFLKKVSKYTGSTVPESAVSDPDDATVERLLDELDSPLRTNESGNQKTIKNSRTGAAGYYQVLPENIPKWTQKHLKRRMSEAEFLADEDAQRRVFRGEFGSYLREGLKRSKGDEETAIRRAGAAWYGGLGRMEAFNNSERFRPKEPSYKEYGDKFVNLWRQGRTSKTTSDDAFLERVKKYTGGFTSGQSDADNVDFLARVQRYTGSTPTAQPQGKMMNGVEVIEQPKGIPDGQPIPQQMPVNAPVVAPTQNAPEMDQNAQLKAFAEYQQNPKNPPMTFDQFVKGQGAQIPQPVQDPNAPRFDKQGNPIVPGYDAVDPMSPELVAPQVQAQTPIPTPRQQTQPVVPEPAQDFTFAANQAAFNIAKMKLPPELLDLYKQDVAAGVRPDTPEAFNEFVALSNENAQKVAETPNAIRPQRKGRPQIKNVTAGQLQPIATQPIAEETIRTRMDDPIVFAVNYANVPAKASVRQWLDDQAVSRLLGVVPGATEADIRQALEEDSPWSTEDGTVLSNSIVGPSKQSGQATINTGLIRRIDSLVKSRDGRKKAVKQGYEAGQINELTADDFNNLAKEGIYYTPDEYNAMIAARQVRDDEFRAYEGQRIAAGVPRNYASLEASLQTGRLTPQEYAVALRDEQNAEAMYRPRAEMSTQANIPEGWEFLTQIPDAKSSGGIAVSSAIRPNIPKTVEEYLDGILDTYGSFTTAKQVENERNAAWQRLMKKGIDQPMMTAVETIAKPFTLGIAKLVPQTIDVISGILDATADEGNANKEISNYLNRVADAQNKVLEDEWNIDKDAKQFALVSIAESAGAVAAQALLGMLTGGAALPTALGMVQGASEQYRDARANPNATQFDKALKLLTGSAFAVPEYFIFRGFLKSLDKPAKALWVDNFVNGLYRKAASVLGERPALDATRRFLIAAIKDGAVAVENSAKEGGQETLEKSGNDLVSSLTYDPKRKVLLFNWDDFLGGAVLGPIGGAVNVAQKANQTPRTTSVGDALAKLDTLDQISTDAKRRTFVQRLIRETPTVTPEQAGQGSVEKFIAAQNAEQVATPTQTPVNADTAEMQRMLGLPVPTLREQVMSPVVAPEQIANENQVAIPEQTAPLDATANVPQGQTDVPVVPPVESLQLAETVQEGATVAPVPENAPQATETAQTEALSEETRKTFIPELTIKPKKSVETSATETAPVGDDLDAALAEAEKVLPLQKQERVKSRKTASAKVTPSVSETPQVEATPVTTATKEPWEMTSTEWNTEWERLRPSSSGSHSVTVAANIGKSAKSGNAFDARIAQQQRLKMGLPDIDSDTGLPWKDSPRQGMQIPARHFQVIEQALKEGKPVPASVLAEYPDLAEKYGKKESVKKTADDTPLKSVPTPKAQSYQRVTKENVVEATPLGKQAANVVKALTRISPNAELRIHANEESYLEAVKESGGRTEDARGTAGFFYDDGKIVHINGTKANDATAFHEGVHAVIASAFNRDPKLLRKYAGELRGLLPTAAQTKYIRFARKYAPNQQDEEFIAEVLADIANGKLDLDSVPNSTVARVKDWLKSLLTRLGFNAKEFQLNSNDDVAAFARKVSVALREGKELTAKEMPSPKRKQTKKTADFQKVSFTEYDALLKEPPGKSRLRRAQRLVNRAFGIKIKDASIDRGGAHDAPDPESGAPLWDLTGVYPDDVYSANGRRYYGTGEDRMDDQAYTLISAYEGGPNKPITIYRAVEKDAKVRGIQPGDWVTIVRQYAVDHGKSALNGNYRLQQKTVHARDLFTAGDSWLEWGYHPQDRMPRAIAYRGEGDNRKPLSLETRLKTAFDLRFQKVSSVEDWDSAAYEKQLDSIELTRDKDGKILAPNGKVSNIQNERLAKVIRSKEFLNWFGPWINDPKNASQVIDENGEPLEVYHGTPAPEDFDEFAVGTPRSESDESGESYTEYGSGADPSAYLGSHFTGSKRVASQFASGLYSRTESANKPRVIPVFLNLRTVARYESDEALQKALYSTDPRSQYVEDSLEYDNVESDEDIDEIYTQYDSDPEFREQTNRRVMDEQGEEVDPESGFSAAQDFAQELAEAFRRINDDVDGVIHQNTVEGGGLSYIAFKPSQIKSSRFNRGSFSSEDSILKSVASERAKVSETGWRTLKNGEITRRTADGTARIATLDNGKVWLQLPTGLITTRFASIADAKAHVDDLYKDTQRNVGRGKGLSDDAKSIIQTLIDRYNTDEFAFTGVTELALELTRQLQNAELPQSLRRAMKAFEKARREWHNAGQRWDDGELEAEAFVSTAQGLINDSVLKKVRDESNTDLYDLAQNVEYANDLVDKAESAITDKGYLELNEYAGELLRRTWAELSRNPYESPFDGVPLPQSLLRQTANRLQKFANDLDKEGYDNAPVLQLIENLKALKDNDYTLAYVYDEAIPEESVHLEDLRAGRTDAEAMAALKQSRFWETPGAVFNRQYPDISDANKASEIAAKLITDQAKKYGWDKNIANFQAEKLLFLNHWADGIVRNNAKKLKKETDWSEFVRNFTANFSQIEKYADLTTDIRNRQGTGKTAQAGQKTGKKDGTAETGAKETVPRPQDSPQEDAKPEPDRRLSDDRKVASFSRILGQDFEYDSQTLEVTKQKAEQLVAAHGGNLRDAAMAALDNMRPSAEGMLVVYQYFGALNRQATEMRAEGLETEAEIVIANIADLANRIVERQVATGQEVNIAKMLEPLSPENSLLTVVKMRKYNSWWRTSPKEKEEPLTPDQTKEILDLHADVAKARDSEAVALQRLAEAERNERRYRSEKKGQRASRRAGKATQAQLLKQYKEKEAALFAQLRQHFPSAPQFTVLKSVSSDIRALILGTVLGVTTFTPSDVSTRQMLSVNQDVTVTERRRDALALTYKQIEENEEVDALDPIEFDANDGIYASKEWHLDRKTSLTLSELYDAIESDKPIFIRSKADSRVVYTNVAGLDEVYGGTTSALGMNTDGQIHLLLPFIGEDTSGTLRHEVNHDFRVPGMVVRRVMERVPSSVSQELKKLTYPDEQIATEIIARAGTNFKGQTAPIEDWRKAFDIVIEEFRKAGYEDADLIRRLKGDYTLRQLLAIEDKTESMLRSVPTAPLSDEEMELLSEYAAGQILQNLPYNDLIDTLTEMTGAEAEQIKDVHAMAVEMIRNSRPASTDAQKEALKIRSKHYREAKKFRKGDTQGRTVVAQEVANKFPDDEQLIYAAQVLTDTKQVRSINNVINDIKTKFGLNESQAETLARRAQKEVIAARADIRQKRDDARNITVEARKTLDETRNAKLKAVNKLNRFLNETVADPNAMKRFNNITRGAVVNNWATQLFNATQTIAVSTPYEALLDVLDVGVMQSLGINIGENNADIRIRDIWTPLAYNWWFSKNLTNTAERALAHYPEQWMEMHKGLMGGDIDIKPHQYGKTKKNWPSKAIHYALDAGDWVNSKTSKYSGAQIQEAHYRNAVAMGYLDMAIRKKTDGAKGLTQALDDGSFDKLIAEADVQIAVARAMKATMAEAVPDAAGRFLLNMSRTLDNFLPLVLNPVMFARFTYTVSRNFVINPLLFGALDSKRAAEVPLVNLFASGQGYNNRSLAKGILAYGAIGIAYMLKGMFDNDDDKWYTLNISGEVIDVRRWFPIAPAFFAAYILRRIIEGKPLTNSKTWWGSVEEVIGGLFSLEFDYFQYGAGINALYTAADVLTNGEDLTEDLPKIEAAAARVAGAQITMLLRFLKPSKDIAASLTQAESALREYDRDNNSMDAFMEEMAKTLPIAGAYGAPEQVDPVTGLVKTTKRPMARWVGGVFVNDDNIPKAQTAATMWAERYFGGKGSGGKMTMEQLRAYRVRQRIINAFRKNEITKTDAERILGEQVKKGTISAEQAKTIDKVLVTPEIVTALTGFGGEGFNLYDKIDTKNIRAVINKATEKEVQNIAIFLNKRVESMKAKDGKWKQPKSQREADTLKNYQILDVFIQDRLKRLRPVSKP